MGLGERPKEHFSSGCASARCRQDGARLEVTIELDIPIDNPKITTSTLARIADQVQAWAVARQKRSAWAEPTGVEE